MSDTAHSADHPLISTRIDDGIAYLCIDVDDKKVNTLSTALTDRFEEILASLQHEPELEGVVLHSGKDDNFIAGFDIDELQRLQDAPDELRALIERGHDMLEQFDDLGVPVVSAIDGSCLGGGLEVALACHGRVATTRDATSLGFPEVQLGVIPGLGGTQRLPRLIDPQLAMKMILTGKELGGDRARKEGLVDDVVHPGILLDVAADLARRLNDKGDLDRRTDSDGLKALKGFFDDPTGGMVKLAAQTPARRFIFDTARDTTRKQAGEHYPAPFEAIDVIETGFRDGFEAGIRAETDAFVELAQSDVSRNLVSIFFSKNQLDKDPIVDESVEPLDVSKVGVLGAGLMGAGIAQSAAFNGYNVRLKDKDEEGLSWGMNYISDLFDKLVRKHKLTAPMADVNMGRVSPTTEYTGFGQSDLVIEAVFEDLDLKQQVLRDVEDSRGDDAGDMVFASNTSTIPISKIAEASDHPQQVLGMHFFSPVYKMPLLEIIRTDDTSDQALATALEVGRNLGKTCIVVDDGPGFFTSRVIGAYINEAGWILQEGASVDAIDNAMKDFGFPVGPLKLVDEVGFDVAVKAAATLQDAFSERWDSPTTMEALADQGRKGKKNEWGFYTYEYDADKGEVVSAGTDESVYDVLPGGQNRKPVDAELIRQRCWLAMLNECAYCLQEGIAREPRDVDIGVIFGLGFPPFRGGVCRYADEVGLERIVKRMNQLAEEFGDRLRPADLLVDRADSGEPFYG
jgi:3-hydroxyacyl-CoA dehydrogenase/enoyl-CoA hydratase/3-hydroxybutyryl-CoA epimerase